MASPVRPGRLLVIAALLASLAALALAPLALPADYSPVSLGVSESAAQGVAGAWVARLGFVLFGLAVGLLAVGRLGRRAVPVARRLPWIAHLVFALAMVGVAVWSTRSWVEGAAYDTTEDTVHSVAATAMGFAFVAGVLGVAATRRHRRAPIVVGDITALAVATLVPLSMSSSIWGVLQRTMFVVAAVWYGREAWTSAA